MTHRKYKIYKLHLETGSKNLKEIVQVNIVFGSTTTGEFVSSGSKIRLEM